MLIMQRKVYINTPRDFVELKENIIQEIRNLTPNIIRKIMETVVKRIRLYLNNNGKHLKDIIFK